MYRRILQKSKHLIYNVNYESSRNILSQAYSCTDVWNERLQTSVLKSFDATELALKISEKLDKGTAVSAVDMDILANNSNSLDVIQMEFLKQQFEKFRGTNESLLTLSSTSYALLRVLLERDETTRLLEVLSDKIKYGIFLDKFSSSLILDYFLDKNMCKEGAQVVYDLMYQEELSGSASASVPCALAWLTISRRLQQLAAPTADTVATPPEDDDEQQKWIVVDYIQKPYYDDHFDIHRETLKLGKSLKMLTSTHLDTTTGRSYHAVSLAIYEKFDALISLLKQWSEQGLDISTSMLAQCRPYLEHVATREPLDEAKEEGLLTMYDVTPHYTRQVADDLLREFDDVAAKIKTSEVDVSKQLEDLVESQLKAADSADIEDHTTTLKRWIQERQDSFDTAVEEIRRTQLKASIVERLEQLKVREEPLTFFEQQDKINIMIKDHKKMESIEDILEEEQYVAPPGERGRAPK